VLALFIVSALVPLGLAGAMLFHHFSKSLQVAQERSLDELARSYGMTLLGRLESADQTLTLLTGDAAISDELAESRARKLSWVTSVTTSHVPSLEEQQTLAPERDKSALISSTGPSGRPSLYLVRRLPSGKLLRAELNLRRMRADASDFSGEATLRVTDAEGRTLISTGRVPADHRIVRSWELFLGSRFASPSWTVIATAKAPAVLGEGRGAYLPVFAFIVLTILLIAWLSITAIRRQLQPLALLIGATKRLAQRDFGAFRDLHWNDEFGDLARSFGTMSGNLQKQFAALETFSNVDQLLLDEPELESILDGILPKIATILGCQRASVLLFDPSGSEGARIYEHCTGPANPHTMRIETHQLRHGLDCTGVLCLAFDPAARSDQDSAVEGKNFADRLSLIIASLRRAEQLRRQARFDALTGLENRQTLATHVTEAVAHAAQRGEVGSLMYIDLDHFKRVNDTSGHAAGDRLLQVVTERLRDSVGENAHIARLGGDEFAVLLPSIIDAASASQAAAEIIARLELPIEVDKRMHHISASIGITFFPRDGSTLEELMRVGDIAMYQAKESGRGKAQVYRPEMQQTLLDRMALEEGLKGAFQRRELIIHYQPIVSADNPAAFGVEALLRWPTEGGTAWTPPSAFIPLAEENGLIVELGHWVLQSTCEQFVRWKAAGVGISYASVNVSVRQLKEPGYLDAMLRTLQENGMRGEELQIEITESVLGQEMELKGILSRIAARGVRLALDDFGTGYSSLGYLRTFPIDTVKIDRSFMAGIPEDREANRLVESIILMCAALGKKVVAEGVETDEQRQYLIRAGCTTLQGYFFGRPMDATDIAGFANRLRGVDAAVTRPSSSIRSSALRS
jgi:diguanylate cyclase (GGDEF)-like protein